MLYAVMLLHRVLCPAVVPAQVRRLTGRLQFKLFFGVGGVYHFPYQTALGGCARHMYEGMRERILFVLCT